MSDSQYCVILVGGEGRRLWSCSRGATPRQFIDFFGTERTSSQQAYDRVFKVVSPDNIFISTSQSYLDDVRQQLPDIPEDRILAEPIHRNTAPSVAWAAYCVIRSNPGANLLVTPSDQMIQNEDASIGDIREGSAFVSQRDELLTLGIKPTRPEPGYDYIRLSEPARDGVYQIQSLVERPEKDFAKMFVGSGELYQDTGMFMANICYSSHCLFKLLPSVLRDPNAMTPNWTIEEENHLINKDLPLYLNLSVDNGVLEKSNRVYVMKCNSGWADIGTWHSIYEAMQRSESDNVVIDSDVIPENCQSNVIKLPKNKLTVLNGLEGYTTAEHGNVLLICKKEDSSALVRKYVGEVQVRRETDYIQTFSGPTLPFNYIKTIRRAISHDEETSSS